MHIYNGYSNPLGGPQLSLALKGALKCSAPPSRKLPINYPLLCKLCQKSEMCLGFYGCLRSGEFCLPDSGFFDQNKHLCIEDVELYPVNRMFTLILKNTKTDKHNNGVKIYVGCSGSQNCAYCLMEDYLNQKVVFNSKSPLLVDSSGSPVRKDFFISSVKLMLAMCGLNPSKYGGHSFRSGSATAASESNFNRWELKLSGRWESECYSIYLRNPKIVSSFAKRLANPVHKGII